MRTLKVISGPDAGRSIEVEQEVVIGREDVDLELSDSEISRRHAVVRPVEGGVEIEDLGSMNGTFVNGEKITEPVTLRVGGQMRLGISEIDVEVALVAPTVMRPVADPNATAQSPVPPVADPDVTAQRPVQPIADPDATAQRPVQPIAEPDLTAQRPLPQQPAAPQQPPPSVPPPQAPGGAPAAGQPPPAVPPPRYGKPPEGRPGGPPLSPVAFIAIALVVAVIVIVLLLFVL